MVTTKEATTETGVSPEREFEDKSLMDLIDVAIGMAPYTSGSLSTTWQVFIQRYPHTKDDVFAESEMCYEVAGHGETIFGQRPEFKTLRAALEDFIRRGLEKARKRQREYEENSARCAEDADKQRAYVAHIESLLAGKGGE